MDFKEKISQLDGGKGLLNYLDTTDFYTAPASVKYHHSYDGGLLEFTCKIYENLVKLNNLFGNKYSDKTLLKVGLLCQLGKVNFYESYDKNIKVMGQWVQERAYKVKEYDNRECYGEMGFSSYMIASRYIGFTDEEIMAICNYLHVNNSNYLDIANITDKYPLVLLLHMAYQSAMYLD